MFNFFKKQAPPPKTTEMNVEGVNPETDNEYMFYEFVSKTFGFMLEPWMTKAKEVGYKFKPQYERAIREKIQNGEFTNPHKFPDYFNNTFDYVAIDFETANNSRLSACAIGLNFVKDNKIVHSKKHFILPPKSETFLQSHTNIHGITKKDVEYELNFKELWESEFCKYFNTNLIIFHNASMDLSVLKNLFQHYEIEPYEISYIDTMLFAEKLGYPKKLTALAKKLNIEINNHHDPECDAEVCSMVFGELIDLYADYKKLIKTIDSKEKQSSGGFYVAASEEVLIENENHLTNYSISKEELENLSIATKGFVVTGTFDLGRDIITDFLMRQGGQLKPRITSKVDYVIAGEDCGWAKVQKIDALNKSNKAAIKILSASDLQFLIEKYTL